MQSLFKSKACTRRLSLLKPSKWLRQPDGKEIKTNWVWVDGGGGGVSSVSYVAVWLWLFMFQKFLKSDEIWCFLHFFVRDKFPPSPSRFLCPQPCSSSTQPGDVGEQAGENQGQDPTPTQQHPFFYFFQDYSRNIKKTAGYPHHGASAFTPSRHKHPQVWGDPHGPPAPHTKPCYTGMLSTTSWTQVGVWGVSAASSRCPKRCINQDLRCKSAGTQDNL